MRLLSLRKCLSVLRYKSTPANIMFVARSSPATGKQEWVVQDEDYDYHQEIARSAYADMLHDSERNKKYYEALRKAIKKMQDQGKPAHVLDIGTGTGLLSMMAVRSGADSVTACEAFTPMAKCAREVMKHNGCAEKIRLIPKRSNEIIVGPDGDMPHRANILVTEVFDTELIGEGAIPTFHHAHKHLLEKDCLVIPSAANMYIQAIHSDMARNWSRFRPIRMPDGDEIVPPADVRQCPGSPSVHDIQMEQLSPDWVTPLSDPIKVFRFDYSGKGAISFKGHSIKDVEAVCEGRCDALLMWWDLEMDTDIVLSCAPSRVQPEYQWRDHWMQAVYYPQTQLSVQKGEMFTLHSCHDDYSLWFDVVKTNSLCRSLPPEPPACRCGAHMVCGWTRCGMMNDVERNSKYIDALQQVVTEDSICLCISDGFILPLMAAKLGAKQVYALETQPASRNLTERYVKENNLEDKIKVISKSPEDILPKDLDNHEINLVLGEPFFFTTTLPWHNLLFWYTRTEIQDLIVNKPSVLPWVISIKAIAVNFEHLWKIRANVGDCEGFDLQHFDDMIEKASTIADAYLEPHPLWEYPGTPLTNTFDILTLDFSRPLTSIKTVEREGFIEMCSAGTCNGVAVWIDYYLDRTNTITTGLLAPPVIGERLQWDVHTRQAVHLFRSPVTIADGDSHRWRLKHKVWFRPKTGDLEFKFEVVETKENGVS